MGFGMDENLSKTKFTIIDKKMLHYICRNNFDKKMFQHPQQLGCHYNNVHPSTATTFNACVMRLGRRFLFREVVKRRNLDEKCHPLVEKSNIIYKRGHGHTGGVNFTRNFVMLFKLYFQFLNI